jgi:DNA-binding LacI/PurR family transcriptional regulator
MDGDGKPVTILDVARHANVSKSLVSLVMRGAPNVSEERRRAVLKAASDLGYRPNTLARGMRGRTYTIGVLLSDLHNPFFAEVVDGIEEALASSGFRAVLGTGSRDAGREEEAAESMLDLRTEGLILLSPVIPEEKISALSRRVPTVLVGRHPRGGTLDTITGDDLAGAKMAVEHLAGLGHERIAHVSGGPGAGAGQRRRGYEEAMRSLGLGGHVQVAEGSFTDEGGYRGAKRLLEDGLPPTAIFAANDFAAVGVLTALEEVGLSVPEDVSLAGYDNTHLASLRHISLTSVDQPRREMGRLSAGALLNRLADHSARPELRLLAPKLVPRSTTAPLAL